MLSMVSMLLLISACATAYRPVPPASIEMMTKGDDAGMEYAYLLDVLVYSRNKKYAKKEVKTGFRIVQLQITNQSDDIIRVRDDVKMYIGGDEVKLVDIPMLHQQLKQKSLLYLLYGLIWINITTCNGGTCEDSLLPVGLAIAAFNIAFASDSNKRFERDLMYQNIIDKEIEPGQTVSGMLGFYSYSMGHLSLKLDR
jgi:hypothetical protein